MAQNHAQGVGFPGAGDERQDLGGQLAIGAGQAMGKEVPEQGEQGQGQEQGDKEAARPVQGPGATLRPRGAQTEEGHGGGQGNTDQGEGIAAGGTPLAGGQGEGQDHQATGQGRPAEERQTISRPAPFPPPEDNEARGGQGEGRNGLGADPEAEGGAESRHQG